MTTGLFGEELVIMLFMRVKTCFAVFSFPSASGLGI